jgi:hypothetical protein
MRPARPVNRELAAPTTRRVFQTMQDLRINCKRLPELLGKGERD